MAGLPPLQARAVSSPTDPPAPVSPSLQKLLQMGFPKSRAQKALAATGHKGVEIARDWLLTHNNDLTLDVDVLRNYVLYACPTGAFADQVQRFWKASLEECDWTETHNYTPHITLFPYFQVPDDKSEEFILAVDRAMKNSDLDSLQDIKMELYTSFNFMGFFVSKENSSVFRSIIQNFLSETTLKITSSTESFHLSLAYQFPLEEHYALKQLVERIFSCDAKASWEIRLYSKDPRIENKQVYKVVYDHSPRKADELNLRKGDFVYALDSEIEASSDEWVYGISWLTGTGGIFPVGHIMRVSESDAWTLHRVYGPKVENDDSKSNNVGDVKETTDDVEQPITYENVPLSEVKEPAKHGQVPKLQKIFVMRHGERVDFTFGKWIPYCFDDEGNYTPKDLNMPKTLPKRSGAPQTYFKDSPLTNIGELQAKLVGKAMSECGIDIQHVFVSPALRCVQTCHNLLLGFGKQLPMCIEPGLFEWLAWYPDSLPDWMSNEEMVECGFNINTNYTPIVKREDLLNAKESIKQFYKRSSLISNTVLEKTKSEGGNIIFVGHAATLDTCSRHLIGQPSRTSMEMTKVISKIQYCSVITLESESGNWQIKENAFPPMTHSNNPRFDFNVLLK